ncbi:MAG: hypothetical protein ACOVO3_01425 [Fluviicola sp.]|jgi:hypothetical protein
MKKTRYLLPALLLLFSCGGNETKLPESSLETEVATEKELPLKKMTFEEAMADTLSTEHPVEIEGYIQLPTLSTIGDKEQSVSLFGRKNQTNGLAIYTKMPVGSGKNSMKKLPLEYDKSDVKITGNKGETLGLNQRVKLTGKMYYMKSYTKGEPGTTYFTVEKIEEVDDKEFDYSAWKTVKSFSEISKDENRHNEYYIEGTVEVPMFVLTGWEMAIDLKKGGETVTIKIMTGKENNQMEDLKENWTKKDIKIRNFEGKMIKPGQKVRVYGVAALDGLHVERIE